MAPASSIPPPLPPSVEEAYHRKCIQLKQRTDEVEEANDAAQIRLNRLKRQVEKMRLERAFLLEQLQKRTSTNVEDSEGSPSPPPTPKEKPLRTKRGHRKASPLANIETPPPPGGGGGPSTSLGQSNLLTAQNLNTLSPSSEAFSRSHSQAASKQQQPTNGDAPRKSSSSSKKHHPSAFDLYCAEVRPTLEFEDDGAAREELSRRWAGMADERRREYEVLADRQKSEAGGGGDGGESKSAASNKDDIDNNNNNTRQQRGGAQSVDAADPDPQDEDVEMAEAGYDSGEETQGDRD